ncbi:hypothetical protein CEUSTIGMA_g12055.t1 [Chlamydomonas eustigma]|uniref:Mce/MlaD domain-containing protein n=1 Tax=Chlamydomonas eustigma TaxID=1157962 RepID=A0A250XNG8_9CHLO|nr:hypothetical protein CEUSTIGMA_g12055.t1 [Chlamydomonas eustigma]|eukprot:GAX84634.1 hypothetical protein CEUSTIGMA_g12055.t1 [Chlamydomonas eustigma]
MRIRCTGGVLEGNGIGGIGVKCEGVEGEGLGGRGGGGKVEREGTETGRSRAWESCRAETIECKYLTEKKVLTRFAETPAHDQPKVPLPKPVAKLLKSLQDFGIGKNSLREGGTGLFLLGGVSAAVSLVAWARSNAMRVGTPYQITIEFPLACGITIGTPLRVRGVQVGQVLSVRPSLEKVDVLCEVQDVSTVVPLNSVIETSQSGLIAEPLIDVTPQLPLPTWRNPPNHPDCQQEGAIVCENGRTAGEAGVALDDLVYIMTRLARQAEEEGFDKVFAAAEEATRVMKEAQPLLQQSIRLVGEITPLLKELREGGLVKNVEALTSTAAAAAEDIHVIHALQLECLAGHQ